MLGPIVDHGVGDPLALFYGKDREGRIELVKGHVWTSQGYSWISEL